MTLVIHPQDHSTDFLKPIYNIISNKKVITGGITYNALKHEIEMHDEVIMCGHGYVGGLFAISQFPNKGRLSYIVDDNMAMMLKEKRKIVTIWCYATDYIKANDINNSFHSGMFISEVEESLDCGLIGVTQAMVDESNDCFSEELGTLIALPPAAIYEAMQNGGYCKLAKTNSIAAYNFKRLNYK